MLPIFVYLSIYRSTLMSRNNFTNSPLTAIPFIRWISNALIRNLSTKLRYLGKLGIIDIIIHWRGGSCCAIHLRFLSRRRCRFECASSPCVITVNNRAAWSARCSTLFRLIVESAVDEAIKIIIGIRLPISP